MSNQTVSIYLEADSRRGTGVWAALLRHDKSGVEKILSGASEISTFNRLTLIAARKAIRALKTACSVTLYTSNRSVLHHHRNPTAPWTLSTDQREWQKVLQGIQDGQHTVQWTHPTHRQHRTHLYQALGAVWTAIPDDVDRDDNLVYQYREPYLYVRPRR